MIGKNSIAFCFQFGYNLVVLIKSSTEGWIFTTDN
ncbi:hypothetical protein B6N60_03981 [Richelia sinica FACHB-800]|uniref:Uncharacterized protein n=1 Tax=Richelia sinica FACHB-800 TaxID=1357546 RepID=A0A975TAQ5_9NOST|nr:hypothetical protein B6N60_03981 [Richelia sinica FACHB-800]